MLDWSTFRKLWSPKGAFGYTEEEILHSLERLEHDLGTEWLERRRSPHWHHDTLRTIELGMRLAHLDYVTGSNEIIEKLRKDDESAEAELAALHIIANGQTGISVDYSPTIAVGNKIRRPDFRVRMQDEIWTYIEVTAPRSSENTNYAVSALNKLMNFIGNLQLETGLKVFLRRVPTDAEIPGIAAQIISIAKKSGPKRINTDLYVILSDEQGFSHIPNSPDTESFSPGIFSEPATIGGPRHGSDYRLGIYLHFSEVRIEDLVKKESRQLPGKAPGLIMIGGANVSSGLIPWHSDLTARFNRKIHTRVSGVCHFIELTDIVRPKHEVPSPTGAGITYFRKHLIENPQATSKLPDWLAKAVSTNNR